jgi:hypothetical protein
MKVRNLMSRTIEVTFGVVDFSEIFEELSEKEILRFGMS